MTRCADLLWQHQRIICRAGVSTGWKRVHWAARRDKLCQREAVFRQLEHVNHRLHIEGQVSILLARPCCAENGGTSPGLWGVEALPLCGVV